MDSRAMVRRATIGGWQEPHGPTGGVFGGLKPRCTTGDQAMPPYGYKQLRHEYQLAHLIEQEILRGC
jgi:hypothetical protein